MPFFFILPLWLLTVLLGIVMVCARTTRRAGVYVITMSTFATILSLLLSTVVLVVGPRITVSPPEWMGLMVFAAYLIAIPIGGLTGAIAGFVVARKLLARLSRYMITR